MLNKVKQSISLIRLINSKYRQTTKQYFLYQFSTKKNKKIIQNKKQNDKEFKIKTKNINQVNDKKEISSKLNLQEKQEYQIFKTIKGKNIVLQSNKPYQSPNKIMFFSSFVYPIFAMLINWSKIFGHGYVLLLVGLPFITATTLYSQYIVLIHLLRFSTRYISKIELIKDNILSIQYLVYFKQAQTTVYANKIKWNIEYDNIKDNILLNIYKILKKIDLITDDFIPIKGDKGIWLQINQKSFWVSSQSIINPRLKYLLQMYEQRSNQEADDQQSIVQNLQEQKQQQNKNDLKNQSLTDQLKNKQKCTQKQISQKQSKKQDNEKK